MSSTPPPTPPRQNAKTPSPSVRKKDTNMELRRLAMTNLSASRGNTLANTPPPATTTAGPSTPTTAGPSTPTPSPARQSPESTLEATIASLKEIKTLDDLDPALQAHLAKHGKRFSDIVTNAIDQLKREYAAKGTTLTQAEIQSEAIKMVTEIANKDGGRVLGGDGDTKIDLAKAREQMEVLMRNIPQQLVDLNPVNLMCSPGLSKAFQERGMSLYDHYVTQFLDGTLKLTLPDRINPDDIRKEVAGAWPAGKKCPYFRAINNIYIRTLDETAMLIGVGMPGTLASVNRLRIVGDVLKEMGVSEVTDHDVNKIHQKYGLTYHPLVYRRENREVHIVENCPAEVGPLDDKLWVDPGEGIDAAVLVGFYGVSGAESEHVLRLITENLNTDFEASVTVHPLAHVFAAMRELGVVSVPLLLRDEVSGEVSEVCDHEHHSDACDHHIKAGDHPSDVSVKASIKEEQHTEHPSNASDIDKSIAKGKATEKLTEARDDKVDSDTSDKTSTKEEQPTQEGNLPNLNLPLLLKTVAKRLGIPSEKHHLLRFSPHALKTLSKIESNKRAKQTLLEAISMGWNPLLEHDDVDFDALRQSTKKTDKKAKGKQTNANIVNPTLLRQSATPKPHIRGKGKARQTDAARKHQDLLAMIDQAEMHQRAKATPLNWTPALSALDAFEASQAKLNQQFADLKGEHDKVVGLINKQLDAIERMKILSECDPSKDLKGEWRKVAEEVLKEQEDEGELSLVEEVRRYRENMRRMGREVPSEGEVRGMFGGIVRGAKKVLGKEVLGKEVVPGPSGTYTNPITLAKTKEGGSHENSPTTTTDQGEAGPSHNSPTTSTAVGQGEAGSSNNSPTPTTTAQPDAGPSSNTHTPNNKGANKKKNKKGKKGGKRH